MRQNIKAALRRVHAYGRRKAILPSALDVGRRVGDKQHHEEVESGGPTQELLWIT
jgi:hypothetical protein